MMSGLRPIHSVETMTCTSEMSGTASSGVAVIAQMPHSVSTTVPVNTRKRLPAHQSMIRAITWLSCPGLLRGHRQLFRRELLSAPHRHHRHVPFARHHHLPFSPVDAIASGREVRFRSHLGHLHLRHGGHVELRRHRRVIHRLPVLHHHHFEGVLACLHGIWIALEGDFRRGRRTARRAGWRGGCRGRCLLRFAAPAYGKTKTHDCDGQITCHLRHLSSSLSRDQSDLLPSNPLTLPVNGYGYVPPAALLHL